MILSYEYMYGYDAYDRLQTKDYTIFVLSNGVCFTLIKEETKPKQRKKQKIAKTIELIY